MRSFVSLMIKQDGSVKDVTNKSNGFTLTLHEGKFLEAVTVQHIKANGYHLDQMTSGEISVSLVQQ